MCHPAAPAHGAPTHGAPTPREHPHHQHPRPGAPTPRGTHSQKDPPHGAPTPWAPTPSSTHPSSTHWHPPALTRAPGPGPGASARWGGAAPRPHPPAVPLRKAPPLRASCPAHPFPAPPAARCPATRGGGGGNTPGKGRGAGAWRGGAATPHAGSPRDAPGPGNGGRYRALTLPAHGRAPTGRGPRRWVRPAQNGRSRGSQRFPVTPAAAAPAPPPGNGTRSGERGCVLRGAAAAAAPRSRRRGFGVRLRGNGEGKGWGGRFPLPPGPGRRRGRLITDVNGHSRTVTGQHSRPQLHPLPRGRARAERGEEPGLRGVWGTLRDLQLLLILHAVERVAGRGCWSGGGAVPERCRSGARPGARPGRLGTEVNSRPPRFPLWLSGGGPAFLPRDPWVCPRSSAGNLPATDMPGLGSPAGDEEATRRVHGPEAEASPSAERFHVGVL